MLYILLVFVLIILSFYLNQLIIGKLSPHLIIFNLIWFVLSIFAWFMTKEITFKNVTRIYFLSLIIMFIASFNFSIIIFKINNYVKVLKRKTQLKELRIFIFMLLLTFILIFIMRSSFNYLLKGDLNGIRYSIYYAKIGSQNSSFSSGITSILVQWLFRGIILSSVIVNLSAFLRGESSFKPLFFSYILVIIYSLLTAGRILIFYVSIMTILSIFFINGYSLFRVDAEKRDIFISKRVFVFISSFILLLPFVFLITRGRILSGNIDTSVFSSIRGYLFSPIKYFALVLDQNFNSFDPLYGGTFFGGFFQWVNIFARNIFSYNYNFGFQKVIDELTPFLYLGHNKYYNAFPTTIYYFYRDGGIVSIFIETLLLGFITNKIYDLYNKHNSLRLESLYLFLLTNISISGFRWEGINADFWVILIFIYIFTSPLFTEKVSNKNF